ncbi:MAG: LysM peptidoglycan-binding domain-containing protein [Verrucomicrobiota bacterium]|jgi:LysM repeat protein
MLEQKNKTRARVRLAVFFVLSIHVIGLMALLMQGCRKPTEPEQPPADTNATAPPSMEATNPPTVDTNLPPAATAPPAAQEYVVAKGDTFSSIAKKTGVTVKAIEEANPQVQSTKLKIGQKLQIPAPASAPAAAAATDAGTGGEQTYSVKSGDTLTKIASQLGVTVKALRSENNLTTDKIKVGQKLKIPAKASAPPPVAPTAPAPAPPATTPTA